MSGHPFTRVLIPPRKLVVITAPSGAGKSSIVKKLLQQMHELAFSVSCTTREKRTGEKDGVHYHFISAEEFKKKITNNEFVEYEEVYPGKFYGTLKVEVERIWNQRKVVVFELDIEGALNLKQKFGDECFTIFIAPPSQEVLINRLKNRGTEDAMSLKARIKRGKEELTYSDKFDKVAVNRDFDTAYMRVKNHIIHFLKPQMQHVH